MYSKAIASIEYNAESPFNGILHNIYYKENKINLLGSVSLVASSYEQSLDVYKIIGVNNTDYDTYFETENCNNSWIQFEFNKIKVVITNYSYRTLKQDFHNEWELQGSNNNISWDPIDHRNIELSNNNSLVTKDLNCNKGNTNSYSYIRLQSLGKRSLVYGRLYTFSVYGFELYGQICISYSCLTYHDKLRLQISLIYIYICHK